LRGIFAGCVGCFLWVLGVVCGAGGGGGVTRSRCYNSGYRDLGLLEVDYR